MWGSNIKLSNVIPAKSKRKRGPAVEEAGLHQLTKHENYAMKHTNYHANMIDIGLVSIIDVDAKVCVMSETDPTEKVGEMNLKGALYNAGHSLFGEIHQAGPLMSVDVVVGNTSEADKTVEMMNTNIAAYLYYNSNQSHSCA